MVFNHDIGHNSYGCVMSLWQDMRIGLHDSCILSYVWEEWRVVLFGVAGVDITVLSLIGALLFVIGSILFLFVRRGIRAGIDFMALGMIIFWVGVIFQKTLFTC